MKKLRPETKIYLCRHARIKHRHEIKRKHKRKIANKLRVKQSIARKRNEAFYHHPNSSKHTTLLAPAKFSLLNNPAEVIEFFVKAKKSFDDNIPVYFDHSNVTEMGPETLTYFCAQIADRKFTNGVAFQGKLPTDKTLKSMFIKAGFYDIVRPLHNVSDKLSLNIYDKLIHKVTGDEVDGVIASKVCLSAMEHTYNSNDYKIQNFYPILVECMANTHNHAGGGVYACNWWMLAYKEPHTKITKFCFLDLGVGIFKSLKSKYKNGIIPEKLRYYLPSTPNKMILRQIFSGSKKTSTVGLQGRGEGIGYVYRLVKNDKTIRNFTVLSNNVIAKISYNSDDTVDSLAPELKGTIYYWELHPNHE